MKNEKDITFDINKDIEIKEMPDIYYYDDIINAAKSGRLVIFIGAGVSKQIGLPLWKEFAFNRLDTVYENGFVDFRTYCDLKNLEPKKLLTICDMFLKEKGINPQPAKEIFKIRDYKKYKEVYGKLYSMNAIYVTTNYDECLDNFALNIVQDNEIKAENSEKINDINRMMIASKSPLGEVVIRQSDLLESKLQNGNVIHIHGSVNDESGMIVTLSDYMLHYGNLYKDNHPELSIFLDRIFNTKYVVLFMGYGLEEYEILEYMLSKVKNPGNDRKHYLLSNCFKEDSKLTNLLRKYYLGFGVELIPYDISKKGYAQLITIIEEWSKVLNKLSREQDFIQKMQFIDEVIADDSPKFDTDVRAIIERVKKDESLEKYLFRKISDSRWLDLAIENGFYNPESVPTPIDKGDGNYSIPYWIHTDYLNRLLSNGDNLNKETIEKVLNIIRTVSLYKNDEGKSIDNYHVWDQFAEIINKIPNEFIANEIIELTRVWTKSKFKIDFAVKRIGEALLGKFLNSDNSDDFNKVQLLINIVTALNPDTNELIIGNYYFLSLFNTKMIELIAQKVSMSFIEEYMSRVTEVLKVESSMNIIKNGNDSYNIKLSDDGQKYIISVSLSANDKELRRNIGNQTDDTDCKLLHTKEIAYCSDDNFTKCVIDWLNEIFSESKLEENVNVVIRYLYYNLYSKGSYYSFYAPQHKYYNKADELILYLYKDIVLKKFSLEDVDATKLGFICNLINNKYFALKKVALYVIGNLSNKYLSVLWDNIDSETMKLIFEESYFGDELRVTLENINQIDEEHSSKLLKLIESGPYSKYSSGIVTEKHKTVWRVKRLNALKHIVFFNEYIKNNYKEFNNNVKLGPTIGEVEMWSSEKSPFKEYDLSKMTNEDLASFISSFKTSNRWEGPTAEGLGRVLREIVKNNPEKYDANLMPFIDIGYYYIYEILNGLLDALKEKKTLEWNNILDFFISYINRSGFWEDALIVDDDLEDNHRWVIDVFADLICYGTQDDKNCIEYANVQKCKEIIIIILNKVVDFAENININNDYLHFVLNSTKGRVLKALLCISLYFKRSLPEEIRKDAEWDNELKVMFNKYMDSNILDSYILLGEYLPQFMSLDKKWAVDKVSSIKVENKNWEGFMVGYIYSRTIYKDIYKLMKTHYKYSIYHTFKKEEVIEDVAHHIALGYISDYEEETNNELFEMMLEKWDYRMISKVLWYFWTYDDLLKNSDDIKNEKEISGIDKAKIRKKIIDFWDKLYNRYKNINPERLSDTDKKIISNSIKLTGVLENIDKNCIKLISLAIPYAQVDYNAHYFIEKISELSSDGDSVGKRLIIGGLILELVKNVVPTYPEEEIVKLVKYLYAIKDEKVKECADSICNIYAKNNIEFLRDICLENRDF